MSKFSFLKYSFWILFVITTVLRVTSLDIYFADHDEGSYWVSALEMARGEVLYQDVMDIKPPGIFYFFYILVLLHLDHVITFRIIALLFISLGAFYTGKSAKILFKDDVSRWVASLLFILSFCNPMSISLNTELIFVPLIAISFHLVLRQKHKTDVMIAGLFAGLAFITKTLAVTDAFVIGLFALMISGRLRWDKILIYSLFGALPFVLLHIGFYFTPYWDDFIFVIYELPFSYGAEKKLKPFVDMLAVYQWRFIYVALPSYLFLFNAKNSFQLNREKLIILLFGAWILLDWVVILLPNKIHFHYWLQLAPVMALAATPVWTYLIKKVNWEKQSSWISAGAGALALAFILNWNYRKIYEPHDHYLFNLIDTIEELREPTDQTVWIVNLPSSMYYYLDSDCPTPYVHSTLLVEPSHLKAFHIDTPEAWEDACTNSDLIIWKQTDVATEPAIQKVVDRQFIKVKQVDHLVSIYRKRR